MKDHYTLLEDSDVGYNKFLVRVTCKGKHIDSSQEDKTIETSASNKFSLFVDSH